MPAGTNWKYMTQGPVLVALSARFSGARGRTSTQTVRARTQRGFTLVETMVVIAIIGVLAGLMIGVNGTAYGANATSVSDQLTSTFGLAKLRAISTRRHTRVEIRARTATVWQSSQTGLVAPTAWEYCQTVTIPRGVTVWDGSTTVYASPGATVVQNPDVAFAVDFLPDGSSTGGTIFVTDTANAHPSRVLVYRATGSSYARADW
jgi:prepilin-type N-terminal cleavage/methylation domain-containing protein